MILRARLVQLVDGNIDSDGAIEGNALGRSDGSIDSLGVLDGNTLGDNDGSIDSVGKFVGDTLIEGSVDIVGSTVGEVVGAAVEPSSRYSLHIAFIRANWSAVNLVIHASGV